MNASVPLGWSGLFAVCSIWCAGCFQAHAPTLTLGVACTRARRQTLEDADSGWGWTAHVLVSSTTPHATRSFEGAHERASFARSIENTSDVLVCASRLLCAWEAYMRADALRAVDEAVDGKRMAPSYASGS